MMIYEKLDTIAILKAIGFSGSDVNRIFITIALSIGLVGGTLGLLFWVFGLSGDRSGSIRDGSPSDDQNLPGGLQPQILPHRRDI